MKPLAIWLFFFAFALPMGSIAVLALHVGYALQRERQAAIKSAKVVSDDGIITSTNDGSVPAWASIWAGIGPVSLGANGRVWAAMLVLIGLICLVVGMVGLFHFPSPPAPSVP